jgi:hypothetical protein
MPVFILIIGECVEYLSANEFLIVCKLALKRKSFEN